MYPHRRLINHRKYSYPIISLVMMKPSFSMMQEWNPYVHCRKRRKTLTHRILDVAVSLYSQLREGKKELIDLPKSRKRMQSQMNSETK